METMVDASFTISMGWVEWIDAPPSYVSVSSGQAETASTYSKYVITSTGTLAGSQFAAIKARTKSTPQASVLW